MKAILHLPGRGRRLAKSARAGFGCAVLIFIMSTFASDDSAGSVANPVPFSCGVAGLGDLAGAAHGLAVILRFYGGDSKFAATLEFDQASGNAEVAYLRGDAAEMARQIQRMEAMIADGKIGDFARQSHLRRLLLAYAWTTGEKAPLEKLKRLLSANAPIRLKPQKDYDSLNRLIFPLSGSGELVAARLAILKKNWKRFGAAQERLAQLSRTLREELSSGTPNEVPTPDETPNEPVEPSYASMELGRIELLRAKLHEMALAADYGGDRLETLKLFEEASKLLAFDCVPELHAIAALGAIETRLAGIAHASAAAGGPDSIGARQLNELLFTAWNLLAEFDCHAMPALYRESRGRLDRILALAGRIEVAVMKGLAPPDMWATELAAWLPECSP